MDNVLFVLQMWGMAVGAWNVQKIDNLIERVQGTLEEEVSGISCEPQNWSEERVDHVIAATLPVVTTFLLALQELYAMKEEILVAEREAEEPDVAVEPYGDVDMLMKDYGLYCGVLMRDSRLEGVELDLDSISPRTYLESTMDGVGVTYDTAYEFLRAFLWSQWEIENELLDLGIHE